MQDRPACDLPVAVVVLPVCTNSSPLQAEPGGRAAGELVFWRRDACWEGLRRVQPACLAHTCWSHRGMAACARDPACLGLPVTQIVRLFSYAADCAAGYAVPALAGLTLATAFLDLGLCGQPFCNKQGYGTIDTCTGVDESRSEGLGSVHGALCLERRVFYVWYP